MSIQEELMKIFGGTGCTPAPSSDGVHQLNVHLKMDLYLILNSHGCLDLNIKSMGC